MVGWFSSAFLEEILEAGGKPLRAAAGAGQTRHSGHAARRVPTHAPLTVREMATRFAEVAHYTDRVRVAA